MIDMVKVEDDEDQLLCDCGAKLDMFVSKDFSRSNRYVKWVCQASGKIVQDCSEPAGQTID